MLKKKVLLDLRILFLVIFVALIWGVFIMHHFGFSAYAQSSIEGVICVAPTGEDTPNCGSADLPCRTIQYAVEQAPDGAIIKVAQGIYTGTGEAVVKIVFGPGDVGKDLTIIGGYNPPNWDTPVYDPSLTMIDGEWQRRGIYIVSVPQIEIKIQNLTIQRGLVDYRYPISYTGEFSGAGLYCRNDHPYDSNAFVTLYLSNVVFSENRVEGSGNKTASGGGASLYQRCRAYMEDVTFEYNKVMGGDATDGTYGAQAVGGGLLATKGSNIVAKNLTFIGNTAVAGSGGRGYGSSTLERADAVGGGASFQYNTVYIDGVTAIGNVVIAGQGEEYGGFGCGGGLFFEHSSATVMKGLLKENSAYGGASPSGRGGESSGGAIMATDSTLTLDRLQIFNNISVGGDGSYAGHAGGGGLYFTKSASTSVMKVNATNLIIADNSAQAGSGLNRWGGGGAIFSQDAELTLINATIANNSVLPSMVAPGIIVLHNYTSSIAHIQYSIIANHPSSAYPRAAVVSQRAGDEIYLDHTLFWNNAGGNTAIWYEGATLVSENEMEGDPKFSSPGPPNFDYHLSKGSVAIDKADIVTTQVDVDGDPRPFRTGLDLGADEYAPILLRVSPISSGTLRLIWRVYQDVLPDITSLRAVFQCEQDAFCPSPIYIPYSQDLYTQDVGGLTNYKKYSIYMEALGSGGEVLETSNTVTAVPTDIFVFLPLTLRGF